MWAWSDHVVTKMTSETTLNPNPPVGEKEQDTTPHKPPFVPKDSSYNDFLRRVAPERQKLLDVAVKFLVNPRVINSREEDKVAFLNKKGLNEEEIYWVRQEALTRDSSQLVQSSVHPLPPPTILTAPVPSQYSLVKLVIRGVVAGSVLGLLIYWIKGGISKLINGLRAHQERQEALAASVQEVKATLETTMHELQQSTLSIKVLLERQQEQINQVSSVQSTATTSDALRTINSEISTLKGLLLNRHQFPTPQKDTSLTSGIPSWQRNASLPTTVASEAMTPVPVVSTSTPTTTSDVTSSPVTTATQSSESNDAYQHHTAEDDDNDD